MSSEEEVENIEVEIEEDSNDDEEQLPDNT